jgi:hypothetical protein
MKKQQKPQSDKKEKKRTIEGNKAIDSHNEWIGPDITCEFILFHLLWSTKEEKMYWLLENLKTD